MPTNASVIQQSDGQIVLQITISPSQDLMETEERIQEALSQGGRLAEKAAIEALDTDGAPLLVDGVKLYSKGRQPKEYQTPYGPVQVHRHVYQSRKGGATFCPLEKKSPSLEPSPPKWPKSSPPTTPNFPAPM